MTSEPTVMGMTKADWYDCMTHNGIPEYMQGAVVRYLFDRREPGEFLKAVLENNLMMSFALADHINKACIGLWAMFIYNEFPSDCHGSPEAVRQWLKGDPV